ncbi:MAG: 3'-5' exonuclease, partial [Oscillospiraceae bacterium]
RQMFEYVAQNTLNNDNVFDVLCSFSSNDKLNTGRISYIKAMIAKFDKLSPSKVLDLILYDFGYMDYLDDSFSKKSGMDFYSQKVTTLKIIANYCKTTDEFIERIFYVDSLVQKFSKASTQSNITLTSAHSAKGLEFDHVFIIDIVDGIFPSISAINQFTKTGSNTLIEEEARLFYVAVTRSKNNLEIISFRNLEGTSVIPSRFLARILDPITEDMPIQLGSYLEHKMFGIGEVLSISQDCRLFDVQFQKMGRKTLAIEILQNHRMI